MGSNVVCVVGAGVAGLTAANACAENGVPVAIVERSPYPGGRSASYGCKATDNCVQCGVCLIRDALARYGQLQNVRQYLSTTITATHRNPDGSYTLDLASARNAIDPDRCVNCGNCAEACERGAIGMAPGWGYYVADSCDACGKCVDSCGFGALELNRPVEHSTLEAAEVIIASGFSPYEPGQNRKWGYGQSSRLITGTELEALFRDEQFVPGEIAAELGDGEPRVAFVQCVGSRNAAEGIESCSRVCCAYALRMANRLCTEFPGLQVDFYYMDLQHFSKTYESFIEETRKRVNFVRSNPISVSTDIDGRPIVRFDSMPSGTIEERAYNLVVLSHGVMPGDSNRALARQFGLDLSPEGFILSRTTAGYTGAPDPAVHVCGAAAGPMGIAESVELALQVAGTVTARMRQPARSPE